MSDFKRSVKSSSGRLVASVFGQVINVLGQICVVPLFLLYWTKQSYGEWLVITSIPYLLWSIEGGLAGLAQNRIMFFSSVGDWKKANEIFQNIFAVQLVISVAMLGFILFFVEVVNVRHLLSITAMSPQDARFILVVMVIYMLMGWGISLLKAPYYAIQLSVRGLMVVNFWKLCDFLVICLVLVLHGKARALAVGEACVATSWFLLAYLDLQRRNSRVTLGLRDVSWTVCKTVFRDGMPVFLGYAGTALFIQGYPMVITRTLGPLAVVNFTTVRTITRVFLQGIIVLVNSVTVELSSSFANKKWHVYLRWVKILAAVVLWGCTFACLGLALFGPWVLNLWTHGKVFVDGRILFLFGISISLQAAWYISGGLLFVSNKHHVFSIFYFGLTLLALTVASQTIGRFGFVAVPVIMIVADAVLLAVSSYLCVRQLPEVQFGGLLSIFYPNFYVGKAGWLLAKARTLKFPFGKMSP